MMDRIWDYLLYLYDVFFPDQNVVDVVDDDDDYFFRGQTVDVFLLRSWISWRLYVYIYTYVICWIICTVDV